MCCRQSHQQSGHPKIPPSPKIKTETHVSNYSTQNTISKLVSRVKVQTQLETELLCSPEQKETK